MCICKSKIYTQSKKKKRLTPFTKHILKNHLIARMTQTTNVNSCCDTARTDTQCIKINCPWFLPSSMLTRSMKMSQWKCSSAKLSRGFTWWQITQWIVLWPGQGKEVKLRLQPFREGSRFVKHESAALLLQRFFPGMPLAIQSLLPFPALAGQRKRPVGNGHLLYKQDGWTDRRLLIIVSKVITDPYTPKSWKLIGEGGRNQLCY